MATIEPRGKRNRTRDRYFDGGNDNTFAENTVLFASLLEHKKELASRILELADQHLPGDENLLLRAWIGGWKEIPLGDGWEPLRQEITLEELRIVFQGKELRNHDIHKCIHNHILPDLRRIIADDCEAQRLLACVEEDPEI